MKFDPETIYDLAADTARVLVGELYRDRDEKNIESVYKRLLNKPEDFMIIPGLASVCKLLRQKRVRRIVFCHYQKPRCILVNSVHNTGAHYSVNS